ncbi:unnamed protein product [Calicophoron daubneyi]|uniref:DUF3719 domain-containing protein n=1 Tax=Calicophoron daubneyi TaxID=300641 RepID=A0AAV2TSK7_CALDB
MLDSELEVKQLRSAHDSDLMLNKLPSKRTPLAHIRSKQESPLPETMTADNRIFRTSSRNTVVPPSANNRVKKITSGFNTPVRRTGIFHGAQYKGRLKTTPSGTPRRKPSIPMIKTEADHSQPILTDSISINPNRPNANHLSTGYYVNTQTVQECLKPKVNGFLSDEGNTCAQDSALHRVSTDHNTAQKIYPEQREYTTDCAVSAWLLQCNNASVVFEDGEDTAREIVEEDDELTSTELKSTSQMMQGIKANAPGGTSDGFKQNYDPRSRQGQFSEPIPNKVAQSSDFVRSSTFHDLHGCDTDFVKAVHLPEIRAEEPNNQSNFNELWRSGHQFETPEGEPKFELNSNNATDWASVSSSEWGDEICEFDRQQSSLVRQMFEEIDRMLYDQPAADTLTSEGRKSAELRDSGAAVSNAFEQPATEYSVNHLRGECEDWLKQFPHLRVVGVQLIPPQDPGFTFYASNDGPSSRADGGGSRLNRAIKHSGSKNSLHSLKVLDRGPPIKTVADQTEGSKNPVDCNVPQVAQHLSKLTVRTKSDRVNESRQGGHGKSPQPNARQSSSKRMTSGSGTTHEGRALTTHSQSPPEITCSKTNLLAVPVHLDSEEIIAMDGEYEEIIAIDYDQNEKSKNNFPSLDPIDSLFDPCKKCNWPLNSTLRPPVEESQKTDPKNPMDITQIVHDSDHKHNPEPDEKLLRLLTGEIWKDFSSWLEPKLHQLQKIANCSPRGEHLSRLDSHLSQESQLNRVKRGYGDVGTTAFPPARSSLLTKTHLVGADTLTSAGTNQATSGAYSVGLGDVLKISTKTLQQREKSILNDLLDSGIKLNAPVTTSSSGDEALPMAHASATTRLSPQPSIATSRPISGALYPKYMSATSRKGGLSSTTVTSDLTHLQTGPGVVGVAANLHHVGRLAPLDRVRTPSASQTSVIDEVTPSITSGIGISENSPSLTFPHGKTSLSTPVHTPYTASVPKSHNACFLIPPPSPIGSSTTIGPSLTADSAASTPASRSCTLPPLCASGSTTAVVANSSNQPMGSTTSAWPSGQQTSRGSHSSSRSGLLSQQQSSATHPIQQHQHAPVLRGTSANLVTQQINNNTLVGSAAGQRLLGRIPARPVQIKCDSSTLPCLQFHKKNKSVWRPRSSISANPCERDLHKQEKIDRSRSTLLLHSCDAHSECGSPRKTPAVFLGSKTDRARNNLTLTH